jgi:GNAT superfamily N-acetyltransferase
MIVETHFENIKEIWYKHLWPNRISKIESHSAMLLNSTYDIKNFDYPATFLLYYDNDKIAGCNSGHMCSDNTYRSRGLYVFPEFRNKGYGKALLEHTINIGKQEHAKSIWSYPRFESWSTYNAAGFKLMSEWAKSETGTNAYCILECQYQ